LPPTPPNGLILSPCEVPGANAREAFTAPSFAIPLGTDENGRDVLARIVYGVRLTLVIGLSATAIGLVGGTTLDLAAGLSHRIIGGLIMGFELLADLKARLGLACLFISHDLGVVRSISDRILVMKNGLIVESGNADDVFDRPQHPYTCLLLGAIPQLEIERTVLSA
jgi:hypothetical protein